jgi:hypothetical protein
MLFCPHFRDKVQGGGGLPVSQARSPALGCSLPKTDFGPKSGGQSRGVQVLA